MKQTIITASDQDHEPTKEEAFELAALAGIRQAFKDADSSFSKVRLLMLEFDERLGWSLLGYPSLANCISVTLDLQKSQTYRLIAAAKVHRNLLEASDSHHGESDAEAAGKEPIAEGLLRPIIDEDLGSEQQRTVWIQAHKYAQKESSSRGGTVIRLRPKHVKQAIASFTGGSVSLPKHVGKKKLEQLRQHIDKALKLCDQLALSSKVMKALTQAQRAIDE